VLFILRFVSGLFFCFWLPLKSC